MTPKQRFDQSLYHWVYPPTQNPPSHSALMSKILGKAESKPKSLSQSEHADWEFYKEREEEWKVSFRSAYFTVKNGAAPFLYYVNSEFSVLFHYPNESQGQGSNGNSFKAVLSQSTPGLRKALARDGNTFALTIYPRHLTHS